MNPVEKNANDLKVVTFHNSTDICFTPAMGCMYDGRAIHGEKALKGENPFGGIDAGESILLPYHVGHRLATNLAKVAILKTAPAVDPAGIPTGVPLWDTARLENLKKSYITDQYSETAPIAVSETDKLMAKVEELRKFVEQNVSKGDAPTEPVVTTEAPTGYKDKAEVIAELTKREIKFDARQNKDNLEKLLA